MKPAQAGKRPGSPAVRAQIDENLKRVYNEALSSEIPDRLTTLLAQLQAQTEDRDKPVEVPAAATPGEEPS